MKKLITAVTAALVLTAAPSQAEVSKENEAYVGLFFGASLAALLYMGAHEDEAESD